VILVLRLASVTTLSAAIATKRKFVVGALSKDDVKLSHDLRAVKSRVWMRPLLLPRSRLINTYKIKMTGWNLCTSSTPQKAQNAQNDMNLQQYFKRSMTVLASPKPKMSSPNASPFTQAVVRAVRTL